MAVVSAWRLSLHDNCPYTAVISARGLSVHGGCLYTAIVSLHGNRLYTAIVSARRLSRHPRNDVTNGELLLKMQPKMYINGMGLFIKKGCLQKTIKYN